MRSYLMAQFYEFLDKIIYYSLESKYLGFSIFVNGDVMTRYYPNPPYSSQDQPDATKLNILINMISKYSSAESLCFALRYQWSTYGHETIVEFTTNSLVSFVILHCVGILVAITTNVTRNVIGSTHTHGHEFVGNA